MHIVRIIKYEEGLHRLVLLLIHFHAQERPIIGIRYPTATVR